MSSYGNVSVGDTATLIKADNTDRIFLDIANTDTSKVVYIGIDTSVTTSNGFPVFAYQNRGWAKTLAGYLGPIYGIVASGTADVRYMEVTGS